MDANGETMAIGALARRAGCGVDTIRYYERIGLMPPAPRGRGGHRRFGPAHLRRLRLIRRARDLGLGLAEARELVEGAAGCGDVRALLGARRAELKRRIAELRRLDARLGAALAACGDADGADCRVVAAMLAGEPVAEGCCGPATG